MTIVRHNQGKQAFKRVRRRLKFPTCRDPLPSLSIEGNNPVRYLCKDGKYICADCVNFNIRLIDKAMLRGSPNVWVIVGVDVNSTDDMCKCGECLKPILPAN